MTGEISGRMDDLQLCLGLQYQQLPLLQPGNLDGSVQNRLL